MTKQERIDEINEAITEVFEKSSALREEYGKILETLRGDEDVNSSDLQPDAARAFQLIVIADMIVMRALRRGSPVEFVQHLEEKFEVYEMAYSMGSQQAAQIAEIEAERAREKEESASLYDWPEDLTPH